VLNNKVSDGCVVETSDHVKVTLRYSMRVNFEAEPTRWFEVENYVKFLCDHVRSVLKGQVKKLSIETFYAASVDAVRDVILGKPDDKGQRSGMRFPENGMHVTDVEVLNVVIGDDRIAQLLNQAQHEAVESNITLLRSQRSLDVTKKQEDLSRQEAEAKTLTAKRISELEVEQAISRLKVALTAIEGETKQHEERKKATIAKVASVEVDHQANLSRERAAAAVKREIEAALQTLRLEAMRAEADVTVRRFEAAQHGFSEALLTLSNHDVLVKVAEAMSVQSFVGGKTLTDVVDRIFAGTPLEGLMERIKARAATTNGGGTLPPAPPTTPTSPATPARR